MIAPHRVRIVLPDPVPHSLEHNDRVATLATMMLKRLGVYSQPTDPAIRFNDRHGLFEYSQGFASCLLADHAREFNLEFLAGPEAKTIGESGHVIGSAEDNDYHRRTGAQVPKEEPAEGVVEPADALAVVREVTGMYGDLKDLWWVKELYDFWDRGPAARLDNLDLRRSCKVVMDLLEQIAAETQASPGDSVFALVQQMIETDLPGYGILVRNGRKDEGFGWFCNITTPDFQGGFGRKGDPVPPGSYRGYGETAAKAMVEAYRLAIKDQQYPFKADQ